MMEFQSCFDLTGLFSKENTYALHPEGAQWPLTFVGDYYHYFVVVWNI